MTYYDHATAMAYKLDRWQDEPVPQDCEREMISRARRLPPKVAPKRRLLWRWRRLLSRSIFVPEGADSAL